MYSREEWRWETNNEFQDRLKTNLNNTKKTDWKKKRTCPDLRDLYLWDNEKRYNNYIIGIPKREEIKDDSMSEKILAENFTN